MGSGQMPNVADVRFEIAKIKKMVAELYERQVISEPIIDTMIPTVEIPNIWAEPADVQVKKTKEKRKEKKRKREEEHDAENKAKADSIQDEWDRETRIHEMDARAGGSIALIAITEGVDVMPLSADSVLIVGK